MNPENQSNQELDYPSNLDIVTWKSNYYQVAGTARTNNQKTDIFLLNELKKDFTTIRVKGAKFVRTLTEDPPEGFVYRREEGVKVTGMLIGGKKLKR